MSSGGNANGVGAADVDWQSLQFSMTGTEGRSQSVFKNGSWGPVTWQNGVEFQSNVFAGVLHYGQAVFEGLKAYTGADGQVRLWNDLASYQRLQRSCERSVMPAMPEETWTQALDLSLDRNRSWIPPASACKDFGCSAYVRAFVFASGAGLAPGESLEFTFMVLIMPVGMYLGTAGVPAQVVTDFDRAAADGMGAVKCVGNYLADMYPAKRAKELGYMLTLYLDPVHKKFVEEFNGANFVAITRAGVYVTPKSPSILRSNTNQCLMQMARDKGIKVEQRPIDFLEEVGDWVEVAAVGTAYVVAPIGVLGLEGHRWTFPELENSVLRGLRDDIRAIQLGAAKDPHGLARVVPMGPAAVKNTPPARSAVRIARVVDHVVAS